MTKLWRARARLRAPFVDIYRWRPVRVRRDAAPSGRSARLDDAARVHRSVRNLARGPRAGRTVDNAHWLEGRGVDWSLRCLARILSSLFAAGVRRRSYLEPLARLYLAHGRRDRLGSDRVGPRACGRLCYPADRQLPVLGDRLCRGRLSHAHPLALLGIGAGVFTIAASVG